MEKEYLKGRVAVKVGDITQEKADAIVNAANRSLMGGGGVDGAIHRSGGPEILEACRKIRGEKYPDGLPDGGAVETAAGRLNAKYVIHTAGPVWNEGRSSEEERLADCYEHSLRLAETLHCRTIAFPALSTGVYRFPKDRAAEIASTVIKKFLRSRNIRLERVTLVFFSEEDARIFNKHQKF
jgi:O-acetyl-ADP-ribose deacetylase (regulator of RNase III)